MDQSDRLCCSSRSLGRPKMVPKWQNRTFRCRVVPFSIKLHTTLEQNAFLEGKVDIPLRSGAGDNENLSQNTGLRGCWVGFGPISDPNGPFFGSKWGQKRAFRSRVVAKVNKVIAKYVLFRSSVWELAILLRSGAGDGENLS